MMHIKTALMVYLFGALVLTGCASSTPAVAPTIRATAIPSPSPTAVTFSHATAGKARAAKPSAPAKPKVAGAKKSAVAINGVKRGVSATDRRIVQYMLAAANASG
jgi:hypothetical protein